MSVAARPAFPLLRRGHPLGQGLIAAHTIHEGSGLVLVDGSGYGNHGAFGAGGAAPTWMNGSFGRALSFDGGDSVNCGSAPAMTLTKALTIAAGVTTNSVAVGIGREIAVKSGGYFWLGMGTDKARFLVFTGGNDTLDGATTMTTARDYSIAGTWSSVDNTQRLYMDGVLDASQSTTGDISDSSGAAWLIGGDSLVNWNGTISYVYLYNRVLSQLEIAQLHRDPFQMFRHRRRTLSAAAAVASASRLVFGGLVTGGNVGIGRLVG